MPILLAPWFLVIGVAAVVPVALHLLHRRRPKPMPFSSLRFLVEAAAKTRRSRHLTNFLTLLMRVLIILLLALSFAQPKVRFATWLPQGKRTVVLVLDGSASMGYQDGEKTCFMQATEWALQLLRSLDSGDAVALLVPGLPEPRVIFPAISDHEAAARALAEAKPGYGTVGLAEVLNDLLARLPEGGSGTGVEIHVFSDFQKTNCDLTALTAVTQRLPERDTLLFLNHVRPAVAANAGFVKTAFYPPAVLGDGEFQASATIRASSDYQGGNTLRLIVNGEEQGRRAFSILPAQTAMEGMSGHATGEAEFVQGQVELDPDGLAADNISRFCLPRIPGIPVLLVDGSARADQGTRDTFFLDRAIQPRGKARTLFLPKTIDWQALLAGERQEGFNVIFVCNPPSLGETAVARLSDFARDGGTVVLMPGQQEALERELRTLQPLQTIKVRKEELGDGKSFSLVGSLAPAELEKRLLSVIPAPSSLVVRRRLLLSDLPAGARTLFQYPDGAPFLVEVPFGLGSFWLASVSANRDWSEWPLSPFFVVLTQELIKSCAHRHLTSLTTTVGNSLPFEWQEEATELEFRLRDPAGRERVLNVKRADNNRPVVLNGFDEPGFYRVARGAKERMIAVNVPPEEGDLSYLTVDEMAGGLPGDRVQQASAWQDQQQNLVNLRHGRPLWPFLLCIAFFLAATEEIFANLRSRTAGFSQSLRLFLKQGGRAK
ncbi:MAG: hypothetical protein A3K19_18905 [Lentisphaerae bacterium RIFOXYB12_FULL_65_16]|nr:MAG: hypothetical protein A3K18_12900 [Lentisphaerae bacterium RIFOXYA12_64_32]OGV86835.1 MAG: hypothetical protein A3K19_18905 [Lentisphaerae bacterium RIFOXYB12_FULL_65_16]